MIDKFLDGKCAVYLDKKYPELIDEFYNSVYDRIQDFEYPFGSTMLDYFKKKVSGPYFFVQKRRRMINGGSLEYVTNSGFEVCYPEDFIDQTEFNIEEDEFEEIFI